MFLRNKRRYLEIQLLRSYYKFNFPLNSSVQQGNEYCNCVASPEWLDATS
jgi:hypothetical protein